MIGRLEGVLLMKEPPALLININGVGYELEAPMTTFYDLPAIGSTVTLHTHFVVREDAQLLYGFSKEADRRLFRSLIRVNGIGPRVALAILSGLSQQAFNDCILAEDAQRLTQVPGIGRKTADRLIVEMRDKVDTHTVVDNPVSSLDESQSWSTDPVSEAVSALSALGYKPQEASRLVRTVSTDGLATEEIIRQALKSMAG